jgi:branched-chain amino acid transport system ATP-binding protein
MQLEIKNLHVSYGKIRALHSIDFSIDKGEIVCIIGANGAGKSTTLRAISRLIPTDKGSAMIFEGKNLLQYPPDKVVSELGISHVPEGRRLFGNLTVMENLQLATFARRDKGRIARDVERVFTVFPRLMERKSQMAGTLSGGEQQMLAVGRAYMSGRKLMLLDEPSMGRRLFSCSQCLRPSKRSTVRAPQFCSSNRMPAWPLNLPNGPTSWKTVVWCCKDFPENCSIILR